MSSFSPAITTAITAASAKAFGTIGACGLNVVPVSMIRVNAHDIWLFDFFMKKTCDNLAENPTAALTCWTGMEGIQVKGRVAYVTAGPEFDEAVAWVATQNPNRVVKGLIVFTPERIFDISPGGVFSEADLSLPSPAPTVATEAQHATRQP